MPHLSRTRGAAQTAAMSASFWAMRMTAERSVCEASIFSTPRMPPGRMRAEKLSGLMSEKQVSAMTGMQWEPVTVLF